MNAVPEHILKDATVTPELARVAEKVYNDQRITPEEGVLLYEKGSIGFLGHLGAAGRAVLGLGHHFSTALRAG